MVWFISKGALINEQPFHVDVQVWVDGISKSALEAAVELAYTGAHLGGRHGVSLEEVVEAGAALGLPFSAENVYCDSEKTIFEVTPAEPSLHLRSLEHSSRKSKVLEPQSHPAPCCAGVYILHYSGIFILIKNCHF